MHASMASREASLICCCQQWILSMTHWRVAVNGGFYRSFIDLLLSTFASSWSFIDMLLSTISFIDLLLSTRIFIDLLLSTLASRNWPVAVNVSYHRSFIDLLLATMASKESSLTCWWQRSFLEKLQWDVVSTVASRWASFAICCQRWLLQKLHWPVAVNGGF